MLIYQQIILLIVSSANIIFAENFFQPVYENRGPDSPPITPFFPYTPSYPYILSSPSYPYILSSPYGRPNPFVLSNRQWIEELKKQFSKWNPETREKNPVYAATTRSSNLVGYPEPHHHYPYYHNYISRRPINTLHYVKVKPHEYVQPSIFVAHPNSLAAHYRRKRSTDFTDVKSSKSTIDDVATKPSLIDTKDSTIIDSLLPENKSKNDKHVRTRQSDFKIKPFLFGLDPSKMSKRQAKSLDNLDGKKDETQHSVSKRHHISLITPVFSTQSTPDSTEATITEPAAQTAQQTLYTFQEKGQYQEPSHTNEISQFNFNVPSTNLEQPLSSITTSQRQLLEGGNAEIYPNARKNVQLQYLFTITTTQGASELPEGGKPIDRQPNCKSYSKGSITICKSLYLPKIKPPLDRNAEIYPNTRNNMKQSSSSITTSQRWVTNVKLPEGGEPIDGRPNCKSYNNGSLTLCISDKVITEAEWYPGKPNPYEQGSNYTHIMRNAEMYPNTRNNMDQDILQETADTDATHITQPRERTKAYYYLNNTHQEDYLETDNSGYQTNYDYDNDNTLTYQTNDGLDIYTRGNSAYSHNVPSKQIDDNMLYGGTNARSYIAPMTYTALTSSNIPLIQQQPLYAYYPRKTYVTYTPQYYNYYKPYNYNYQGVSKGFYRLFWPSTYNY